MTETLVLDKKFLCGDYPFGSNVKSAVFSELVKLAQSIIEHYQGDLFHDAIWIEKHVTGPTSFYWGCDAYGTVIGTYTWLPRQSRENVWDVRLSFEKSGEDRGVPYGRWFVTITKVSE